jgi:type VI protein secretion system component VasK
VTFWAELFLGVIALATFTMAAIQVAVIVYGWTVARRINRMLTEVERQMQPLAESLNAIARDAARVSSLAAGQVERVDRLVSELTDRIEQTATTVQDSILKPLRNGAAMLAGVRAAIDVFREIVRRPGSGRRRSEDEDALFIG